MQTAVIIGAGPAGLTTAYELHQKSKDWQIIVLEASDTIGGISRTVVCGDCRIDIGGHRFFSKSKEINDLWSELMPIQGKPAKDDLLLGTADRLSSWEQSRTSSMNPSIRTHGLC